MSHVMLLSFAKTEIKPGDGVHLVSPLLMTSRIEATPEVLVLFAPEDVEVVQVIAGSHVAKIRERNKAIVEHDGREFVLEFEPGRGRMCNGLSMMLNLRAGEHGGEVRAHILGRRE